MVPSSRVKNPKRKPVTLVQCLYREHNSIYRPYLLAPPVALRPNVGHGLLILEVSRSHTATHHSRQDSSGRVISSSQRPLRDNTQHSQQTNIHVPGGIRTHVLSRLAALDLRLRLRVYWDRHRPSITNQNTNRKQTKPDSPLRKPQLTIFFQL